MMATLLFPSKISSSLLSVIKITFNNRESEWLRLDWIPGLVSCFNNKKKISTYINTFWMQYKKSTTVWQQSSHYGGSLAAGLNNPMTPGAVSARIGLVAVMLSFISNSSSGIYIRFLSTLGTGQTLFHSPSCECFIIFLPQWFVLN